MYKYKSQYYADSIHEILEQIKVIYGSDKLFHGIVTNNNDNVLNHKGRMKFECCKI